MSTSVYTLNKGINQPLEFKGLKAQYVWYGAGGMVVLLLLFALLYISGLSPFLCLALIGTAGALWVQQVYRWSHRYGPYGFLKKLAARRCPRSLRTASRNRVFPYLKRPICMPT